MEVNDEDVDVEQYHDYNEDYVRLCTPCIARLPSNVNNPKDRNAGDDDDDYAQLPSFNVNNNIQWSNNNHVGDDADDYAQLPSSNDNDKDVDVEYVGDDADDHARHSCPPPMSMPRRRTSLCSPHALTLCSSCLHILNQK